MARSADRVAGSEGVEGSGRSVSHERPGFVEAGPASVSLTDSWMGRHRLSLSGKVGSSMEKGGRYQMLPEYHDLTTAPWDAVNSFVMTCLLATPRYVRDDRQPTRRPVTDLYP